MKKRKFIVMIIVLVFTLSNVSFGAYRYYHRHWKRGPYYTLSNNTDVYKYYTGCSHRRSSSLYDSFEELQYDLYLTSPSGTTSVPGKIGFEYGTNIKKDTHFGFNSLKYYNSRIQDYKDALTLERTSLNGSAFSDADEYTLNLLEDDYTLYSRLTDRYPGETVEDSLDFYVGPYPTVSCKITLNDDNNKNTHYDKIKIEDIKLISTYEPNKLKFELYKGNTLFTSFETTPESGSSSYDTGWKTAFHSINSDIKSGTNLKPGEQINIRVRVDDGRGTGTTNITNPNAPKYAKYSNSPVY